MAEKHGSLSINSENIFPIIKKWLYSDHDIFYRELISNGCDAITKLKKLDMMGEYALPDGYKARIDVIVDPAEKTLKFIDNGIGMTADEVEEYINQIAFSGATDFIEKYKDKGGDDQIIGHFGLGFYSAFMVADEVHIDTLFEISQQMFQISNVFITDYMINSIPFIHFLRKILVEFPRIFIHEKLHHFFSLHPLPPDVYLNYIHLLQPYTS